MKNKAISSAILTMLTTGMLIFAFNIEPVEAYETIYIFIRPDGNVTPSTVPIRRDGDLYTFTQDIAHASITVQRSNIIVDGDGHALQGPADGHGITLSGVSYVTIRNTNIKGFSHGVFLDSASHNVLSGNNITGSDLAGIWLFRSSDQNNIYANRIVNDTYGISLADSSNNNICTNTIDSNTCGVSLQTSFGNNISRNYVGANTHNGIFIFKSSNNIISWNNMTENGSGGAIWLLRSSNANNIYANNMTNNSFGILLDGSSSYNEVYANDIVANRLYGIWLTESSDNSIYHNNFINNPKQVYDLSLDRPSVPLSTNVWDKDDSGNFWSDYVGTDSNHDGIGDSPYIIDANNQDRYPLMNPWREETGLPPIWIQWWFWLIVFVAGIMLLVGTIYFLKKRKPLK